MRFHDVAIFTHAACLDGAVSARIAKLGLREMGCRSEIIPVTYETVGTVTNSLLAQDRTLFYVDMRPPADLVPQLVEREHRLASAEIVGVRVLDHHASAQAFRAYDWAIIDERVSASLLAAAYFGNTWVAQQLLPLAVLADDRDRWIRAHPLSDVLFLWYRHAGDVWLDEKVQRLCLYPSLVGLFTRAECEQAQAWAAERAKWIADQVRHAQEGQWMGRRVVVTEASRYHSELAQELLATSGADVAIIWDPLHAQVHLRATRPDVAVHTLAEQFGGGGHPQAAGFRWADPFPRLLEAGGWQRL